MSSQHAAHRRWLLRLFASMGAASALGSGGCGSRPGEEAGGVSATRSDPLYGAGVQTDQPNQSPLVNAVGLLALSTGGSCSGTLITPNKVLTSGHCFCDGNQPVSFTLPNLVPYSAKPTTGFALHPGYTCSPTMEETLPGLRKSQEIDLAIVFLQEPVPPQVTMPARVYLGDVVAASSAGWITNIQIAGFGATNHFACKPDAAISSCFPNYGKVNYGPCIADGARRHGDIGPITALTDHCDKIMFEGECWPHTLYSMVISDATGAIFAPGDSGGPLFAEFQGEPMVFGVTSGWVQNCLDHSDPIALWASTYYDGNDAFLVATAPEAAQDLDQDGILDAVDNCPPSRCVYPAMCSNPSQADADQDGVGDRCDNCSPLKVAKCFADPLACSNPGQLNKDGDLFGDICDLCPKNPAGSDWDLDGVPNACDVLEDAADPPLAACPNGIADCPAAVEQECLQDGSNSVCAEQADVDLDGIADVVDLCPLFKTSDNSNGNCIAEDLASVARRANPCDPAPILKLKAVYPPPSPKPLPASPAQRFSTAPSVGRVADTDPVASFTGTKTFRACTCMLNGQQVALEDCVRPGAPCDGADVVNGYMWKSMTLTGENGNPVPSSGTASTFSTSGPGTTATWIWQWRKDYDNGVIPGPLVGDRLHAALAAQVALPHLLGSRRPSESSTTTCGAPSRWLKPVGCHSRRRSPPSTSILAGSTARTVLSGSLTLAWRSTRSMCGRNEGFPRCFGLRGTASGPGREGARSMSLLRWRRPWPSRSSRARGFG